MFFIRVGSNGDEDITGSAGIYRFPASSFPTTFTSASRQIVALGLRNEVGIRYDSQGRLWGMYAAVFWLFSNVGIGVENGDDDVERPDLGIDVENTNPGEELV